MPSGTVENKGHRLALILTTISFLLITSAIVSIYDAPMKGYELSVYESTPTIFWIAMILGLFNGIFLFVRFFGKSKKYWALGLLEIILCNALLISLYVYRGTFYLERTDSLSYVGYAKELLSQGTLFPSDIYPMISVLMVFIGEITGQSMIIVSQFLPALFYSIFTVSMLCWAMSLSKDPKFISAMMLASMPLMFAWFIPTLMYQTLCVLMLPLFFFILRKGRLRDARFKIMAGVLIVFFTLGHPLVAIGIFLFLIIIQLTESFVKSDRRTISSSLILFTFVVLFGWIALQASLVHDLRSIAEQMFGLIGGSSTFGDAQGMASKVGIWSTVQSILVCCIDDLLYILLALWVGIIVWRNKWRPNSFAVIFACFLGGSVFLAAIILMTFAHNLFRLINLNFVMILAIPLVGFLLCYKKRLGKVRVSQAITLLVLASMVITVFAMYQDPIDLFPNGSVTHSEIAGSNWFIDGRGINNSIYEVQTVPWRFADLIYGASYNHQNPELRDNEMYLSEHFGTYLASNNTGGSYLVLSTYDELAYTQVWQSVDRFNTNDFIAVASSTTVDRIYDNSGFSLYSRT
jgi:hypothetical protein